MQFAISRPIEGSSISLFFRSNLGSNPHPRPVPTLTSLAIAFLMFAWELARRAEEAGELFETFFLSNPGLSDLETR